MLYPHVQAWKPGVLDWVLWCRPRWLKTLHADRAALSEVKRQFPDCQIWYRHYFAEQPLDNPAAQAQQAANAVLADLDNARCREYVGWGSSYNETGLFDDAGRYHAFEDTFADIMRGEGLKTVSYNFSVGQPSIEGWGRYLPVPGDALGLNQYHAPMLDSPGHDWTLLRHVRVRATSDYTGPILVGETGIDRGILGEQLAGWRASGISAGEYCRQLRWAAEQFAETGVTAAFVFNAGGWGWETFEVGGEPEIADTMADLGDRYAVPPVSLTTDLVARYGDGFARALQAYGDVIGDPIGERVDIATSQYAPAGTDPYRFSHLQTTRGTLLWRKTDNGMVFWATGGPVYEFTAAGIRRTAT